MSFYLLSGRVARGSMAKVGKQTPSKPRILVGVLPTSRLLKHGYQAVIASEMAIDNY
jgi:hypothetical protein